MSYFILQPRGKEVFGSERERSLMTEERVLFGCDFVEIRMLIVAENIAKCSENRANKKFTILGKFLIGVLLKRRIQTDEW